jgi:hypothetical protein
VSFFFNGFTVTRICPMDDESDSSRKSGGAGPKMPCQTPKSALFSGEFRSFSQSSPESRVPFIDAEDAVLVKKKHVINDIIFIKIRYMMHEMPRLPEHMGPSIVPNVM